MSFSINGLAKITSSANALAPTWFSYVSTGDAIATIKASGYFNGAMQNLTNGQGKFKVGDVIHASGSDTYELLNITAVTTNVTTEHFISITLDTENIVTTGNITGGNLIATAGDVSGVTGTFSGAVSTGDLTITGVVAQTAAVRPSSDYAYFYNLDCDEFMTGGAAQKTYMLGISGERPVGSAATGDSNDAIIKGSYSNYAACDANFIIRGVNTSVTNRNGGTLGMTEGAAIGAANKSGGTSPTVRGMTIRAENYGTNATEFGVLDVNASDEVGAGTLRYGLRVRSTDASSVAALDAGILLSNTSTYGFDYGMDMNGATIGTADIRLNNGATLANGAAGTLTITETAIDLVGALAADALTLSDVLTFSDGATIDNTAADTLTLTETTVAIDGILTVSGNTTLGDAGTDTITFTAKQVGQLYRNETGVDAKSLKMHNHDTAATMNNEFKYETINTSGDNYGTWNECHIAATGTATLRAQTNVAVVESTFTATDTTLIGSYSQVRGDGDIAGNSFVSGMYSIVGASAAMTATHVNALWLDTHMANTVTGSYELLYMTENGATALDQVMYMRTPGAVAFAAFDTCSAFISNSVVNSGTEKKIKITIDGVVYYINARTG